MKVSTTNPVLIDGVKESDDSYYLSAEGEDTDEFYDADGDDTDEFYDADGDYSNAKGKRKKGGRLKGLIGSGKVAGALAKAQGVLGALSNQNTQTQPEPYIPTPEPTPTKTPLSKNAKIGIVVGIVAVVGIIGFIVYKKMNADK